MEAGTVIKLNERNEQRHSKADKMNEQVQSWSEINNRWGIKSVCGESWLWKMARKEISSNRRIGIFVKTIFDG